MAKSAAHKFGIHVVADANATIHVKDAQAVQISADGTVGQLTTEPGLDFFSTVDFAVGFANMAVKHAKKRAKHGQAPVYTPDNIQVRDFHTGQVLATVIDFA